ncbi:MAG: hypothetical protein RLZZ232_3547 [Planctomycetota bacterium]|jgi:hypothetical protein
MRNGECGFKATTGQIRQNRCIGFLQTDQVVDLPGLDALVRRIIVGPDMTGWFIANWQI